MSKVKGFDAVFNILAFILQAGQIKGHKIKFYWDWSVIFPELLLQKKKTNKKHFKA